ncbi:hypothetical protein Gogos_005472, partial [Gossypium gossypioides]|nr:hypothetical protein [Gossypium gossypioides]
MEFRQVELFLELLLEVLVWKKGEDVPKSIQRSSLLGVAIETLDSLFFVAQLGTLVVYLFIIVPSKSDPIRLKNNQVDDKGHTFGDLLGEFLFYGSIAAIEWQFHVPFVILSSNSVSNTQEALPEEKPRLICGLGLP